MAGRAYDPAAAATPTPGPRANPADPTMAPPPLRALRQIVHLPATGTFTENTQVKDER